MTTMLQRLTTKTLPPFLMTTIALEKLKSSDPHCCYNVVSNLTTGADHNKNPEEGLDE